MTTELSPQAQAIIDVFDVEYYQKARQRQVALAAAVTYVTTKADWNCKNWRIK